VSVPTLKKILVTFGGIMTYACRKRYIDYNPVRDLEKPKGQSEKKDDDELVILTPNQIQDLLGATSNPKYETLFMTAIMTGMREGETLGLKWNDVDWVNSQIHVKRTFNHGRFYEPKTKTSKRKIDMAPHLATQLKKWQLACPPNSPNLVFPNGNGKPMSADNLVKRHFHPALKRANLPKIRFHDLRHAYASIQIHLGANPKYVQKQMGHSSVKVTFDIYGHLINATNHEAANRLGEAIFGATGSKMVAKPKKDPAETG